MEYCERWLCRTAEGAVVEGAAQTVLTENRKKNSKATYIQHQGIHESLMDRVIFIKQDKEAWDGLVSYYTGSDKVKKVRLQTLKRKYKLLQMETTETISYFFSKTLNLVNEMKANGDTVEDSIVVEKILRSLPEKFEAKVTSIEECNTAATMTFNELLGSLQAYEQRLLEKTTAAKQVEEALQSQVRWRNNQGKSNTGDFQGRYNNGGRSNNGSYRKPFDRSRMQCYNCGDFGRMAT
ncbi:uncharacterized protein LOC113280533 [Papaver somniferum]|uniref:uncharacterized protein LOC113280533 n=1 Tax=Papaver somniferum TaxID=3469 RepID=UPI000E7020CF|nr:uncharacterized protein LOC113280533 [Papaver somniferum]